ncbi:MAG: RNase adapter RapZ [Acetobacteraceae bacterium]|nr:RNase adapter RapZ [Pseudomonadota bacterium]
MTEANPAPAEPDGTTPLSVVVVSGLSGGGKASVLRALEDVGYEAVDNPPLEMLERMVAHGDARLAVGIDARTRGFSAAEVLETLRRLRARPRLRVDLVYAWANEAALLRRFTETRRRHPLAPQGRVLDGISAEQILTAELREQADLVVDTSDLPLAGLRRLIEQHFGGAVDRAQARMVVSLISFAYSRGLPPEADLVFDARFLRNPHYDPILRPQTGLDPAVAAYIEEDVDFSRFFTALVGIVDLILPRFVQEGKKYATITIGCTGGRHRSVYLIEKLATYLTGRMAAASGGLEAGAAWRVQVTHRELAREGIAAGLLTERPIASEPDSDLDNSAGTLTVHPQEA